MHGIWLRLPVGLRWRGLPHAVAYLSARELPPLLPGANAKGCKRSSSERRLARDEFRRHFSPMRAIWFARKRQIIDLRHPLRPDKANRVRGNEWARLVMLA